MKQKTKIKIPKNCESFTLEFTFDEDVAQVDDFKGVVEGKYYVVITKKEDYTFMFKSLITTKEVLRDIHSSCYATGIIWHNMIDNEFYENNLVYRSNTRTYREATPEEIQEFKDKELESKFSKDAWYYFKTPKGEDLIFKLNRIENECFFSELLTSDRNKKGIIFAFNKVDTLKITKATQQQIDLFLKPKLEFKENEVWKAKFIDSDVIFIFVVDRVKDQSVRAKMYATDKVLFTGGLFNINDCEFEKSDQIELLKVLYPKNRIWNFGAEKLLKCRKTNETYFYLSTCGNIERRVDVADVTSHNHFNNKNYFYSYEEIKKYKEALKRFNTQWHENN